MSDGTNASRVVFYLSANVMVGENHCETQHVDIHLDMRQGMQLAQWMQQRDVAIEVNKMIRVELTEAATRISKKLFQT